VPSTVGRQSKERKPNRQFAGSGTKFRSPRSPAEQQQRNGVMPTVVLIVLLPLAFMSALFLGWKVLEITGVTSPLDFDLPAGRTR
jgi:hypothetical protein